MTIANNANDNAYGAIGVCTFKFIMFVKDKYRLIGFRYEPVIDHLLEKVVHGFFERAIGQSQLTRSFTVITGPKDVDVAGIDKRMKVAGG